MNERIKELAEQAGFMLWGNESWNPGDIVDWSARYDDELAKFAELIVRECASMARAFHSHEYDFTGDLELDEFMLKHFGVEE